MESAAGVPVGSRGPRAYQGDEGMTPENSRSAAGPDRTRRGIPTRAPAAELGTTRPPRPARRSPLARGERHSPSREPALNPVARLRPGHARTTSHGSPGSSLDLLDPLALAAPLTWQGRVPGSQQLGHNPGPLIGRKLAGFPAQAISSTSHGRILLCDGLDEKK